PQDRTARRRAAVHRGHARPASLLPVPGGAGCAGRRAAPSAVRTAGAVRRRNVGTLPVRQGERPGLSPRHLRAAVRLRHRAARVMVMRFLATLALAALLGLPASASYAPALEKPAPAVRAWLAGCRAFLEHPESMGPEGLGQCAGAVDAMLYIGELLPEDFRYCVPLSRPP